MTKDEKIEALTTHLDILANKIERGEEIDPSAAIIILHDLGRAKRSGAVVCEPILPAMTENEA